MVVTDLHGDWDLYQQYRDAFLTFRDRNQAHTLVLTGDYIHSDEPAEFDQSLAIVLDLLRLKAALGSALVVLLGNHELPHIYHIPLSRGIKVYTPQFETALGTHRQAVIHFFQSLPIWARTKAGVSVCHAGAFDAVHDPAAMDRLYNFSHKDLLRNAGERLPMELRSTLRESIGAEIGMPYAEVARYYLGVDEPEDPRYDDFLLGAVASQHPDFSLLWSALFSANEQEYGIRMYTKLVKALLASLSEGYTTQKVLVTGHIGCRGGYKVLANNRQLRLASGAHAHPIAEAKALIFDAARPVADARALLPGLWRPGSSLK